MYVCVCVGGGGQWREKKITKVNMIPSVMVFSAIHRKSDISLKERTFQCKFLTFFQSKRERERQADRDKDRETETQRETETEQRDRNLPINELMKHDA